MSLVSLSSFTIVIGIILLVLRGRAITSGEGVECGLLGGDRIG